MRQNGRETPSDMPVGVSLRGSAAFGLDEVGGST